MGLLGYEPFSLSFVFLFVFFFFFRFFFGKREIISRKGSRSTEAGG